MIFKTTYEKLFYEALRIRLVEEEIIELYPSDKIQSPVHLSIGQEPVAVGICQNLTKEDLLFCTYRSHAFYLAKGGNLKEMFAELCGKRTGMCKGKAGSMHLAASDVGLMGSSAVVSSTIPHAVGAALAVRLLNKDQITVTVFGDGATEEGVYHESLNFAALHKLPVLFVCEDNGLAAYTTQDIRQSYSIIDQASLYGITTCAVYEGWDLDYVFQMAKLAVENVRKEQKPSFIWFKTYRYKEHVGTGDDHDYACRSKDNWELWKSKDALIQNKDLVVKYTPQIQKEIEEAVKFAEESPFPTITDLYQDVI